MGTGSRFYRAAYGQTTGQLKAMEEHTERMIPILRKEAEMQLEIQEKVFAQQFEQTKGLSLLAEELESKDKQQLQQPVYVSQPQQPAKAPNYVLYIGLAIAAFLLFKKG